MIDFLRAANPDVEHVRAGVVQPARQRLQDLRTAQAHIAPHANASSAGQINESAADAVGNIRVQLIRHAPADVISLETRQRTSVSHGGVSPRVFPERNRTNYRLDWFGQSPPGNALRTSSAFQ